MYIEYLIYGIVVFLVALFLYKLIIKNIKISKVDDNTNTNNINQVIEQFEQWNQCISTKQGFLQMYQCIDDFVLNVTNTQIHSGITKEEFDTLSINAIRELNKQSLLSLKLQLNGHPK